MMDIGPRYEDTRLSHHVQQAALGMAVELPEGLALLYWDHCGSCRAFSLHGHNLHLQVPALNGVYQHYSEIVRV